MHPYNLSNKLDCFTKIISAELSKLKTKAFLFKCFE